MLMIDINMNNLVMRVGHVTVDSLTTDDLKREKEEKRVREKHVNHRNNNTESILTYIKSHINYDSDRGKQRVWIERWIEMVDRSSTYFTKSIGTPDSNTGNTNSS
jgi:hypothetical protein